ncbi:MAG: cation-translocating P-type ATPase [Planctomycetales bacterium]
MKLPIPFAVVATEKTCCDYCGLPTEGASVPEEPVYCCYGCRFAAGITSPGGEASALAGPASALGFSVFFTMNVVMMTMALWSYADQPASPFEMALAQFLRYGGMLFSFPVLLLLGRPLLSHAISGVKRGQLTTDLLLLVGVMAAFGVSIANTVRGEGHIYFEVGCVILVLVTLGRWMEAGGRSQASAAIDQLERLVPDEVRLSRNGRDVVVPRRQVMVGDRIHVIAGERIPVDARLEQGRGVVDEQFFTGESIPVEKKVGDRLLGGTLNLDGDLIATAMAPPSGGALGRLVEAVRTARLTKGRYQLLSDTWSQWFFPVIATVAATAFLVHGWRVNWEYGLLTALSVVLIACPCALALATPLAIWVALGTAAKKSVLFRNGSALEAFASVRALRWDKTGTLTTGTPRVKQWSFEHPCRAEEVEVLALGLSSASRHLFSQAIREFCSHVERSPYPVGIRTVSGRGLQGIGPNGGIVRLGSVGWMQDCGLEFGPLLSKVLRDQQGQSDSLVAIGFDGQVQALFVMEETIRPEAASVLSEMQKLGLDQEILTGDRSSRLAAMVNHVGLPIRSELMPEEKLEAIRQARMKFGSVAMVGDGLNDAPALAAADVGIALGCGADVSRDSADICLLSSDLRLIPWSRELSRQTVRTIRSNLAWSFGYNAVGVVFAATGNLHPAIAAVLMVVSSLMVLGNSLRLSRIMSDRGVSSGDFETTEVEEKSGRRDASLEAAS